MRNTLVIALAFLFCSAVAWSATLELVPLVGFQVNGSKDLAGPRYDRLDFKNAALRGFSIGVLNEENAELEFSWTRAYGAAEVQHSEGAPADRFDVRMERLHLNAVFMMEPAPLQPFLLIGLGATRFTPANDLSNKTLFSFALGGGLKWLWNDHIGLRLDARWTPALAPQGTHFFCESSGSHECYSAESNSYASRVYPFLSSFEFTSGLLLRY